MRRYLNKIVSNVFHCDYRIPINGISSDSRKIKQNYIFCSLSENGDKYISDAIKNGASVIICNKRIESSILQFTHDDIKAIYPRLVKNFYNKQPKIISAVTGTNGKSSVVSFYWQICNLLGINSVGIGTLGVTSNDNLLKEELNLTSPDSADLHRILYNCKKNKIENAILEASSHGLDQHRLDYVNFNSVAFTNLSHDHLDYHKDIESYFNAKLKLFVDLPKKKKISVINMDDPYGLRIINKLRKRNVITYGNNGDLQIIGSTALESGQIIKLKLYDIEFTIKLSIYGKFQMYNLLAAIGMLIANGVNIDGIKNLDLSLLRAPDGRMQVAKNYINSSKVFIDYAHTPNALMCVLNAIKWHFLNFKITLVFGCGGGRDIKKRSIIAKIAKNNADKVIITDDNPRDEDPAKIRREIAKHCNSAKEIPNRGDAIKYAIMHSEKDEVIIIAGKGHEAFQETSSIRKQFNDKEFVEFLKIV